jgi:hypothetical protein
MARTPKKQTDEGAPITRQFLLEVLGMQDERLEGRLAAGLEARMDERFRNFVALLEDMRVQNRATFEAVVSWGQAGERQIAALRDEIVPRLDVIVNDLCQGMGGLRQKVDAIDHKLDGKADAAIEERVAALERAAG